MRTSLAITALGLALLGLSATPARANLIINGSFEDPVVPVGWYTNFLAGSTDITGWTVVGVDTAIVNTNFTQYGANYPAQDGQQFADLAGITSNSQSSGLSQDIGTTAGETYSISFYVGTVTDNQYSFPSTIDLSIDGGARQSFTSSLTPTNTTQWQQFTVQFTATGATTNIQFLNGSAANNYASLLDNVSIVAFSAVPEPGSLALLGIGGASLALVRLTRRRSAP